MLVIPDIKIHFRKKLTPKKCVLLQQFDQVQEVHVDDPDHHDNQLRLSVYLGYRLSLQRNQSEDIANNERTVYKDVVKGNS